MRAVYHWPLCFLLLYWALHRSTPNEPSCRGGADMAIYSCVSELTWRVPFVGMTTVPNKWKICWINNINSKVRNIPWHILRGQAQSHRDLFLLYPGCVHLLDHQNRTWIYFVLISGLELQDWWYVRGNYTCIRVSERFEGRFKGLLTVYAVYECQTSSLSLPDSSAQILQTLCRYLRHCRK